MDEDSGYTKNIPITPDYTVNYSVECFKNAVDHEVEYINRHILAEINAKCGTGVSTYEVWRDNSGPPKLVRNEVIRRFTMAGWFIRVDGNQQQHKYTIKIIPGLGH